MGEKLDRVGLAYANPLKVSAVLDLAYGDAMASKNFEWAGRLKAAQNAVDELVLAASDVVECGTDSPVHNRLVVALTNVNTCWLRGRVAV